MAQRTRVVWALVVMLLAVSTGAIPTHIGIKEDRGKRSTYYDEEVETKTSELYGNKNSKDTIGEGSVKYQVDNNKNYEGFQDARSFSDLEERNYFSGDTRNERNNRNDEQFDVNSNKPPGYVKTEKDYAHLEPPLALPSRVDFSSAPSKRDQNFGKEVPKLQKEKEQKFQEGEKIEEIEWYKDYPKSFEESSEIKKSEKWPMNTNSPDPNSFMFIRKKKLHPSDDLSSNQINPNSEAEVPDIEPTPIYLPVNKKQSNVLYSSLIDMINVAENLRVKRPSPSGSQDYHGDDANADEEDDDSVLVFDDKDVEIVKSMKKDSVHMFPQVAKVQDRGTNGNAILTDDDDDWALPRMGPWDPVDTPVATAVLGSVMLFLILVVVVLALRVHCRNRTKQAQEWIRHPMVTPAAPSSGTVQPILHHPQTEPIRIKAKGLLERRGSNTSLTLELGADTPDSLVAPKECTPEDFLLTAGNRLSRRALRESFRDPRLLHAEFWDIPSNHPDRCPVPGSAAKNRYRTVLPNEETRVVLKRSNEDAHPSDHYINANYIRGYDGEEKAYIATQGPLAHTTGDLWRMVLQEKARAVVMITRLKEKGRVKCEPYIPAYSAKYDDIQVTVKQVLENNGYTIRQIHLKRGDETHTTLHFWFTSWPDHKTPSSARHLLAMAAEVHATKKDGDGPAVVHCSAGIGRTGCFIGVSIGVRQLLEEGGVDVLSIVCQMRLDRGGMVQTAEQYEFIHRALALYEATLPVSPSD